MSFSTRNAYYLRASNYRVIPLFLYLDERHVDWMSDIILQLVIAGLKPKMSGLLMSGKYQKKHKVFVERGEGYQYCYFLRTTTKTEVVLLKQKTYSLRAPSPKPAIPTTPNSRKRHSSTSSRRTPNPSTRSRSRSRSISAQPSLREETPLIGIDDVQVKVEPDDEVIGFPEVEMEDEERGIKSMKPDVDVSYKGFGTSSLQLVLIIEPYPPLPASSYAPPSSRLSSRSTSLAISRSKSRTRQGDSTLDLEAGHGSRSRSRYTYDDRSSALPSPLNLRNPSRSVSVVQPNSRRGGSTRGESSTPAPASGSGSGITPGPGGRGTPLFLPRESPTPFETEEEEEEHEAYEKAVREGRLRLPSVLDDDTLDPSVSLPHRSRSKSSRSASRSREEQDEEDEDLPEDMVSIGERLVRSSVVMENVIGVRGGWEEMDQGEESAVMGREEPGD